MDRWMGGWERRSWICRRNVKSSVEVLVDEIFVQSEPALRLLFLFWLKLLRTFLFFESEIGFGLFLTTGF